MTNSLPPGAATPDPSFSIDVTRSEGAVVLTLRGELDIATRDDLVVSLDDVGTADRVVLDITDLAFLDSSGIHTLIDAHRRAAERGRRLRVTRPRRSAVSKVLSLTGTERLFEWTEAPR